jgi:chemotaxis signal transduction protein
MNGAGLAHRTTAMAPTHLVVRVGGERFAFRVADVEAALDAPQLTPLPVAPAGLLGELRYRDRTVRAFDAGWVLGVVADDLAATALVFRDGADRVVLVVDAVEDLVDIAPGHVRRVPPGADGEGVLLGVCLAADGRLISLVRADAMVERATARASHAWESGR